MNTPEINTYIESLIAENKALRAENLELRSQLNHIQFQLAEFKRMVFGSKKERFLGNTSEKQTVLELGIEPLAELVVTEKNIPAHTAKVISVKPTNHKGRVPFASHIPRVTTVLQPEGNVEEMVQIGVEVTETIEYNPGSFFVNRTERPKYAEPKTHSVVVAQLPEKALGKSMFGNSFAAHVLVSKFVDHTPEYRMIQILKRSGIQMASSSVNEISAGVSNCLTTAYHSLKEVVLKSQYLQVDEVPMRVLSNQKVGKTDTGYFWVYRDPVNNLVFFDYRPNRTSEGPDDILKDYKGKIQADGYAVYDGFGQREGITLLFCWAHARRYFEKALVSDKDRATWVMEQIQQLYAIERRAKEEGMTFEQRHELRLKESTPLLNAIKLWLDENKPSILPKSPIGKAINYAHSRWEGLTEFINDGKLEIDNNRVENNIRPVTLGRKNYLFAGSHEGAKRAAVFYSFFGTCKLKDINPYNWLKETLDQLPNLKGKDIQSMMPGGYSTL